MSLPTRRRKVLEEDRALEKRLGIVRNDPVAERFSNGNVYSTADIEALERHKTRFWRRPKKREPDEA
jgi:hypothetical protein